MKKLFIIGTGILTVFMMGSCEESVNEESSVHKVIVSPSNPELMPGQTVQLFAMAIDDSKTSLDIPITWMTSDVAVASVSENGLVTAQSDGNVTITAKAEDKSGSVDIFISSVRRKILSELFTSST